MKIIELKKCDKEKKEYIINSFREAENFIAVARINGQYKIWTDGMTNEQVIYAAELIKMNCLEGNLDEEYLPERNNE